MNRKKTSWRQTSCSWMRLMECELHNCSALEMICCPQFPKLKRKDPNGQTLALLLCFAPACVLAQANISSEWVLRTDLYGNRMYQSMTLKVEGDNLSGDVDGDKLEGTRNGNAIQFVVKDAR